MTMVPALSNKTWWGYPAEVIERLAHAPAHRVGPLVGGKLNPGHAAVTQRCNECQQGIAATADVREVRLHLRAWRPLEPHHRFFGRSMTKIVDECLELGDTAWIALFLDLPMQHHRWNPVWPCRFDPAPKVVFVRIQRGRPGLAGPVVAPHASTA